MNIHLSSKELNFVKKNIVTPLSVFNVKICLFGSRARGDHNKFSDVDLLIRHDSNLDLRDVKIKLSEINELIVESNFPYKVDLVLEGELAEGYKSEVLACLIEL